MFLGNHFDHSQFLSVNLEIVYCRPPTEVKKNSTTETSGSKPASTTAPRTTQCTLIHLTAWLCFRTFVVRDSVWVVGAHYGTCMRELSELRVIVSAAFRAAFHNWRFVVRHRQRARKGWFRLRHSSDCCSYDHFASCFVFASSTLPCR